MNEKAVSAGFSVLLILILVFSALKVGGLLTYSWWWITAPIWGGFLMLLSVATIIGFVAICILLLGKIG